MWIVCNVILLLDFHLPCVFITIQTSSVLLVTSVIVRPLALRKCLVLVPCFASPDNKLFHNESPQTCT